MNKSVVNAVYGALDYLSYPVGMLLVAPIVLRRMGAAEYGLWMVATSIVSAGAIVAAGFCDAGIQQIAKLRDNTPAGQIARVIRTLLGLTLVLGLAIALALWFASPALAPHLVQSSGLTRPECIRAMRLAGITALVRAVETVPACAQRAYEMYGPTVQINLLVRTATLAFAVALAVAGKHTIQILVSSLVVMVVGVVLQFLALRRHLPLQRLAPSFDRKELKALFSSGTSVWIQAMSSVLFRQCDRILLGLSLGAAAVVPFASVIQLTEPLFGLTASTLSFFFPFLSRRVEHLPPDRVREVLWKAVLCNLAIVSIGAALLLCFGDAMLRVWVGARVAHEASSILVPITLGSALSGLSVTGVYAAQALGLFRVTAAISVSSRSALLLLMLLLLHTHGMRGLAAARLLYGAAALLVYVPVARRFQLFRSHHVASVALGPTTALQQEGKL